MKEMKIFFETRELSPLGYWMVGSEVGEQKLKINFQHRLEVWPKTASTVYRYKLIFFFNFSSSQFHNPQK